MRPSGRIQGSYSEFPQGEIINCEPPDFLAKTDNGIIGVEIVDYVSGQKMDKGSGGSLIRQIESDQAKLLLQGLA